MPFQHVNGKLGNMRKAVEWVVYPALDAEQRSRVIQSDRRVARVDLDSGKAVVSDGKGGHPGFHKLTSFMGATECECPEEILTALRELPTQVGPVRLTG